jgi:hypothetical protein
MQLQIGNGYAFIIVSGGLRFGRTAEALRMDQRGTQDHSPQHDWRQLLLQHCLSVNFRAGQCVIGRASIGEQSTSDGCSYLRAVAVGDPGGFIHHTEQRLLVSFYGGIGRSV